MNINFNFKNLFNSEHPSSNQTIESFIKSIMNTDSNQPVDLRQLTTGRTFIGQIIDIHNKDIQISVGNNQVLHAKLIDMLDLNIGDTIPFMVKENNSSQMVIKPLANKESIDSIVTKALISANLKQSDTNVAIVKELMNQNMPIDKQTIQSTIRNVTTFPEVDSNQIVSMQKKGIEITQSSVSQYLQYAKGDHQIGRQINSAIEESYQSITNMAKNQNVESAIAVSKQINAVFQSELTFKPDKPEPKFNLPIPQKEELLSFIDRLSQPESSNSQKNSVINESGEFLIEKTSEYKNTSNPVVTNAKLDTNPIVKELKEAILLNENQDPVKIVKLITEFIEDLSTKNSLHHQVVTSLLESSVFKSIFKEQFHSRLFIDPNALNEVENKAEYIKDMYHSMEEVFEKLRLIFEQTESNHSGVANNVQNAKGNLDFMQSLNTIFPYVQIPLKLKDYNGHGDLYIYNKSGRKTINEDQLSAFLHLDLQYLGATDVDIKMLRKHVKTVFTLQDQESMDIVEKNIPLLKEKLELRGYQVEYSINTTSENTNTNTAFKNLFTKNESQQTVKRYTFDVRM